MLARAQDAELQLFPRSPRFLWLRAIVAGLIIAGAMMIIGTCRDDRDDERPKLTPILSVDEPRP